MFVLVLLGLKNIKRQKYHTKQHPGQHFHQVLGKFIDDDEISPSIPKEKHTSRKIAVHDRLWKDHSENMNSVVEENDENGIKEVLEKLFRKDFKKGKFSGGQSAGGGATSYFEDEANWHLRFRRRKKNQMPSETQKEFLASKPTLRRERPKMRGSAGRHF